MTQLGRAATADDVLVSIHPRRLGILHAGRDLFDEVSNLPGKFIVLDCLRYALRCVDQAGGACCDFAISLRQIILDHGRWLSGVVAHHVVHVLSLKKLAWFG